MVCTLFLPRKAHLGKEKDQHVQEQTRDIKFYF